MKRTVASIVVAVAFVAAAPLASAQGILIPQNSRIAPFPRPVPGPHPLRVKSLRIDTRVQGQVATTRVQQVFANDLNFPVDGTYFYPLPEDATFLEFATWDGDKKLRGEVLEREEARNRYESIVRRCWDPGLLEYAGANLFQARVFPVPARGDKRVEFAYTQVLKADNGLVSYVYPLQSGTRANPQNIGEAVLTVQIESDQGIRTVYSPTHAVDLQRNGERRARLSYEAKDVLPDRNFQLFYALSNAEFGISVLTYREAAEDGYFMILVSPRLEQNPGVVLPKDILFVLDTSGSMQDKGKLEKALAALKFGVRSLNAGDRFNVITFSTDTRRFREGLIQATDEARAAAGQFIERQSATGGTNIRDALKEAFGSFQPGDRPAYVVFLTDGLPTVGETDPGRILKEAAGWNGRGARLFTFGVGYDVNTFLLDQLAARNSGSADYVAPDEDLEVKLSNFFARLANPVMAGLQLELAAVGAGDIYPRQLPDLFRGSQLTILGRYAKPGRGPVALRGNVRGETRTVRNDQCDFPNLAGINDFLPRLWAMRKVGYLLEQIRMSGENSELKNEIVRLAKKYGFVTPYTSYLAAEDTDLISRNRPIPTPARLAMSLPAGGVAPPAAEAVAASIALKDMKTSDVVHPQVPSGARRVGPKTFTLRNNAWTDDSYDPAVNVRVVDLAFGSDALLAALTSDRQLAAYAALGKNVVVMHRGRVYRIHG